MQYTFITEGKLKAKERPRKGKYGFYTPKGTQDSEKLIRQHYKAYGCKKLSGALGMKITAHLPIPKGGSKATKQKMVQGYIRPVTRPDLDNYIKTVMDALNGVAYDDDSQIVKVIAEKVYVDGNPYTEITIKELYEKA